MQTFINNIVECYKEYFGDNFISLVLFGSRARLDEKDTSDYDILLIAEDIPARPFERLRYVRRPLTGKFKEKISIIAKTKAEFDSQFPSIYLDIGIDGRILFDKNDYMKKRIQRIKEIIKKAGLKRIKHDDMFSWEWSKPKKPGWKLDWGGLSEF